MPTRLILDKQNERSLSRRQEDYLSERQLIQYDTQKDLWRPFPGVAPHDILLALHQFELDKEAAPKPVFTGSPRWTGLRHGRR